MIVDEAHRLKRRNKLVDYKSYDRVNKMLGLPLESTELDWIKLNTNKLLILFYDETQSVKESDIDKDDFSKIDSKKNTIHFYLNSQLRVKGGNEYIDFVHKLFTDSPNSYINNSQYDIRVYDDCLEMFKAIKEKDNEYHGLCRMLSGFTFPWRKKIRDNKSTVYSKEYDFEIDGIKYCWNDDFNASGFITNNKNLDKVGCVYTSQGYDLNYAGVILGNDISYNPVSKKIEFHIENFKDKNAKSKNNDNDTIRNIINAYKVLLTRGVYGTYIYAVDKNLREYIKSLIINRNLSK